VSFVPVASLGAVFSWRERLSLTTIQAESARLAPGEPQKAVG
jgi:hypothetical protein